MPRHEGPMKLETFKRPVYALGHAEMGGCWISREFNVFDTFEKADQYRIDIYADMPEVKIFTLYVQ